MTTVPLILTLTGNLLAERTLDFETWSPGRTQRSGSPGGASSGVTIRSAGSGTIRPVASRSMAPGANIRIGSIGSPSSVTWWWRT